MSQQREKDNEVTLWVNARKQSDRHPDFTGSARVEGVDYYADAWKQQQRHDRSPVLRIRLKPKNAPATGAPYGKTPEDDDIPF